MKMHVGSIENWVDLGKLFLARFFEDDTEVSIPILLATKQKKGESIKVFVDRFRSMVPRCRSGMTQFILVETCHHNLQFTPLTQIGVAECSTWKQLVLQGEQAKKIVTRVKSEEKSSKPRPEKLMRRTPKQSFQLKRKDTLAIETKAPSKPQSAKGSRASGQILANKQYSFKDKHVISLFKLLHKSNKLKLLELRHPEEVSKTDDPNYCLYHRMLRYPTKSCYIFNNVL